MRRNQPDKDIRPVVPLPQALPGADETDKQQVIRQERHYTLITPLYGGGVDPAVCDPITLIRGTEIRGLLRFWWRACFAGRYNNATEMKNAEDRLWGKAAKKGDPAPPSGPTVQIAVEVMPRNRETDDIAPFRAVKVTEGKRNKSFGAKKFWDIKNNLKAKTPPYAAFPLRPPEKVRMQEEEPTILPVYHNVSFILTITFPNNEKTKKEIEAALWAWETFGGIGARTRRGFGALKIQSIKQNGKDVHLDVPSASIRAIEQWLQAKFTEFGLKNKPSKLAPALTLEKIAVIPLGVSDRNKDEVTQIWEQLIKKLQDFRQKKVDKRSIWTESTEIKDIASNIVHLRKGQDKQATYHFPKAVFGLPIVFHVKEGKDVGDLILQRKEEHKERLASPLLLRPFACNEKQAVGLALLLEQRDLPLKDLQVIEIDKNGNMQQLCSADEVIPEQDEDLLEFLNYETDILQHFWKSLKG